MYKGEEEDDKSLRKFAVEKSRKEMTSNSNEQQKGFLELNSRDPGKMDER